MIKNPNNDLGRITQGQGVIKVITQNHPSGSFRIQVYISGLGSLKTLQQLRRTISRVHVKQKLRDGLILVSTPGPERHHGNYVLGITGQHLNPRLRLALPVEHAGVPITHLTSDMIVKVRLVRGADSSIPYRLEFDPVDLRQASTRVSKPNPRGNPPLVAPTPGQHQHPEPEIQAAIDRLRAALSRGYSTPTQPTAPYQPTKESPRPSQWFGFKLDPRRAEFIDPPQPREDPITTIEAIYTARFPGVRLPQRATEQVRIEFMGKHGLSADSVISAMRITCEPFRRLDPNVATSYFFRILRTDVETKTSMKRGPRCRDEFGGYEEGE